MLCFTLKALQWECNFYKHPCMDSPCHCYYQYWKKKKKKMARLNETIKNTELKHTAANIMLPELNSLFEPVVITSNRKWAMKPFPKAPYLTKAYNWLRWAGGVKLCWLREALADITRPKENETAEVQMESLFACFRPAAQRVLPCLLQSQLLSAAVLLQSLIMPVPVSFCVAADCSVCSAVIWTPFCCWRASTTSAPCCCGVRGRTWLSSTPTGGREKTKQNWMCDNMLILHSVKLLQQFCQKDLGIICHIQTD